MSAIETTEPQPAHPAKTPSEAESQIIEFIRNEIQDKSAVLTLETRREDVAIDSIDIVHVIFAIEEKYDIEINVPPDAKFETVGQLVATLIAFIPKDKL